MLNFDERRFVRIQSGAAALAEALREAVSEAIGRGAENLFFLGTGGAGILMMPAVQLLAHRSSFPVFQALPAELVLTGHPQLGSRSLVVIPSLSGTTTESVAALEHCKARGARVLALVGHADSALARGADEAFVNFAEDDTSSESFYIQSLLVALALMDRRGEFKAYTETVRQLALLPQLLLEAKRRFEDEAERLAEAIRNESYHIVTGAGSSWPQAFYYGMCILEEMQWIRTRPVHASDFFHGTLELVEKDVSLLVLKGEDAARPLAERVEAFAPAYTTKLRVLDAADVRLDGISQDVRALVSPVILATLLERVSAHLEVKRNHPLTTRRYYKRVAY